MSLAPTSPMLQAFTAGLAIDQPSWDAGYQAGASGKRTPCPDGMDLFSFYLGRAAGSETSKRAAA